MKKKRNDIFKSGVLEVICGPMFCGKTEELIRRVRRALIAQKKVEVFNHKLDQRYARRSLVSHSKMRMRAKSVSCASEILKGVKDETEIVAIDEIQDFGKELIPVVQKLLRTGKDVIVAGLSTTFRGEPFEPAPHLMAIADHVLKLSAVCSICGKDAVFHVRKKEVKIEPTTITPALVGTADDYEARCRECFKKGK